MKYHTSIVFSLAAIFILIGCKSTQSKDPLLGKWIVKDILREGKSILGPGFKGTTYLFQENGKVKSWTQLGDSALVDYSRRGDSLFWISPEKTDFYLIDSISSEFMQFYVEQDGYQSRIIMTKVTSD